MSTTHTASPRRDSEHELELAARALAPRPSQRAQAPAAASRWWFVFDRWLPVTEIADGQEEFMLA